MRTNRFLTFERLNFLNNRSALVLHRRNGVRLIPWVMVLLMLIAVAGCENGDDEADSTDLTTAELLERGWENFEQSNYSAALEDFQTVTNRDVSICDAWNGAGWSSGRISGGLKDALEYFNRAIELDQNKYDAIGGLAFAIYQDSQFDSTKLRSSIDISIDLLSAKPLWRFLHEQTLDFMDLKLMIAAAHYGLNEYEQSFTVIKENFNSSFEADLSIPSGRRELLEEIERLRLIYG